MATLTKAKLIDFLTRRLRSPEFRLERLGSGLSGSVISDTFVGVDPYRRQKMLWDALEAEFGEEARAKVGTLLPYTEAEWYVDLEGAPAPRRRRPVRTSRGAARRTANKRETSKR
jgi:acid stress-induced BolA-like protein IbaG/YrbA